MKSIFIKESQIESIIPEMAYPSSWNIEDFKEIKSFRGRVRYCEEHLERLGSGSARIVFKIDDEKVLKLAKNPKGVAQNETEDDYYLNGLECFAKTFESDQDGLWIEMELATKCKPSDFKTIMGFSFEFLKNFIDFNVVDSYRNSMRNKDNDDEIQEILDDSIDEWLIDLNDYLNNYQISNGGDLKRISSYGIVKRNGRQQIVIVDYGLNDDVYNTYYKR